MAPNTTRDSHSRARALATNILHNIRCRSLFFVVVRESKHTHRDTHGQNINKKIEQDNKITV